MRSISNGPIVKAVGCALFAITWIFHFPWLRKQRNYI